LTYKPKDVSAEGLLVLRSSNIFDGRLKFDDNVYVNVDVPEKLIVRKDDILICVRNGSRDLIGKCTIIDEASRKMTFGAFMAIFRTSHSRFVFYQLQSAGIKKQIHEHLGATINQITNKSLNAFEIPFPAEKIERTKIANILTALDNEIEHLDKKLILLKIQKKGLMQKLLTGKIRIKA
jgi:type I restriction enzyme S subunit